MSQVVQATCPGCRSVLRIPAAWLDQAFRCKHCGAVIQARSKPGKKAPTGPPAPAAPAVPLAAPAAPPAPPVAPPAASVPRSRPAAIPVAAAPAPPADTFAFEESDGGVVRRPVRRRKNRLVRGLVLAAVLGAGVLGLGLLAWPQVGPLLGLPLPGFLRAVVPPGDGAAEAGRERVRKGGETPAGTAAFPRRALGIAVGSYLYANPINLGLSQAGGRGVHALLDRQFPNVLRIPRDQVAELSDGAPEAQARAPVAGVIRDTLTGFLDSCRPQDRVMVLVVAHVVEIDGEAYVVPVEGDPENKDGLIPFAWVYDKLKACRARQKVLVLDTCRLDPARGVERPGSGPMGEKLDAVLKSPPEGVQVWSACVGGQYSYEFDDGETNNGLFLDELYELLAAGLDGVIQKPGDALPLERLVEAVNGRMKEHLGPLGKEQTSRLSGSEAPDGAAYDPEESPPARPGVAAAAGRGDTPAQRAQVQAILKEVAFPPLKVSGAHEPLRAEAMPPFPADKLAPFLKDDKPATPLREEVIRGRKILAGLTGQASLRDQVRAPADEAVFKKEIMKEQTQLARVVGDVMELVEALEGVKGERAKESRRWQANYDYLVARAKAQLAYLIEYQALMGQLRKELPSRDPKVHNGWRLASRRELQGGDSQAKKLAAESRKLLDKIIADYPDTPWAVQARRDRASGLGLEWQPTR